MSERAYTVTELDALRRACEMRWLYGTTHLDKARMSRSFQAGEKDQGVEQLVRTHMLAGHTAEDLYTADKHMMSP